MTLEELEGQIWEDMSSILQEFLMKSGDAVPRKFEKLAVNTGIYVEF